MNKHISIDDTGTLIIPDGLNISPPLNWAATNISNTYRCNFPLCRRRCFSYGILNHQVWVRLHCNLKRIDCNQTECLNCTQVDSEIGSLKSLIIEESDDTSTTVQGYSFAQAKTNSEAQQHWIVAAPPVSFDVSIKNTLPAYREKQDRKFYVEMDNSIVYAKETGQWEPPRDINGYERDPNDSWRFKSLWEPCSLRQSKGIRNASCGCINFIMTCNNPQCSSFNKKVSHTECADCPFRLEPK